MMTEVQKSTLSLIRSLEFSNSGPDVREFVSGLKSDLAPYTQIDDSSEGLWQRITLLELESNLPIRDFLRTTQNRAVNSLPDSYQRLKTLEEKALDRTSSLLDRLVSHESDIQKATDIHNHFLKVSAQYKTLKEALRKNIDLKEIKYNEDTRLFAPESSFGLDLEARFNPDDSPLRVAAFGRLAAKRLHEDPKYIKGSLLALIGGLRAYVLKNVLYHFEITGFPPEQMGSEEAAEQLEKLQKDVSNPGSPGQVAPGRRAEERIPILDHLLSNPENWKIEDGEPAKPDYSVIFDKAQEEDSELFHIQQGSLRKYIRRHFGLEQKRFEVQKQLIGRYRTNLPDKPSSRQTPGLSGNGRDT